MAAHQASIGRLSWTTTVGWTLRPSGAMRGALTWGRSLAPTAPTWTSQTCLTASYSVKRHVTLHPIYRDHLLRNWVRHVDPSGWTVWQLEARRLAASWHLMLRNGWRALPVFLPRVVALRSCRVHWVIAVRGRRGRSGRGDSAAGDVERHTPAPPLACSQSAATPATTVVCLYSQDRRNKVNDRTERDVAEPSPENKKGPPATPPSSSVTCTATAARRHSRRSRA